MNFNELIENEINKRVEEKVTAFKKEYEEKLKVIIYRKLHQMINELSKKIDEIKIENLLNENEIMNEFFYGKNKKNSQTFTKCDYPDCKNYGNGSIDNICVKCDSYLIKKEKNENTIKEEIKNQSQKENKNKEELKASKDYNKLYEDDIKKIAKAFNISEETLQDFTIFGHNIKDILKALNITEQDLKDLDVKVIKL